MFNRGMTREPATSDPRVGVSAPTQPLLLLPVRQQNAFASRLSRHPRLVQGVIWSVVAASVAVGTYFWATGRLELQNAGYAGAFVANVIGSASIIVPVPGLAVVCGAAAPSLGLNPLVLAVLGGTGSTIGEMTGYLAGYSSQGLVARSRHYDRISRWVVRRGGLALFILAAIPNPVFDIAGLASGTLGYPVRKFLVYVWVGKLLKFALIAYACRFSIDWLMNLV